MDEAEIRRWYGPWDVPRPEDAPALMAGFAGPWWVAGGWAVEAFTGVRRRHKDLDLAALRRDADALRTALADRFQCWSVFDGALRPFTDELPLHPEADQLWVRPGADAPWAFEVLLNPDADGRWVNRRLPRHTAVLDEVTWVREDGLRFLAPEVALLFKAKHLRPEDDADLEAALPLLDDARRTWLREAVAELHPDHRWLGRLR
ncbi:hypothetical protein G5V58_05070 [Nocardioides anomalus]|uniref:Amino acid transporter n=1 Tax=Nocardioides anomalus TaxID=2712223 RepID=A0A6G6WA52_9ACTN|nr:hypothetical protein [Nocardioides anomalus]QIG42218.1 hypothetical protein G5V58_05070 [Nocardioides anomalus]